MKVASKNLSSHKNNSLEDLTPHQRKQAEIREKLKAKFGDKIELGKKKKLDTDKIESNLKPRDAEEKSVKVVRSEMLHEALKTGSFSFNDKERQVLAEILNK